MNKNELHPRLQTPYTDGLLTGGGEKGLIDPYLNTWFVVPPLPPSKRPSGLDLEKLGAAHRVMEEIPRASALSKLDEMILGLLVRREAVASSRMEGTWSTIDHVLTPGEIHDQQEKSATASVRGYATALEAVFSRILTQGPSTLTLDLLRELHQKIMAHEPTFTGTAGKFRNELAPPRYVTIGGFPRVENSIYNPTPPRHLAAGLRHLTDWLHDETLIELGRAGQGLTLPLRMALGHIYFEALHPFPDGNGRVGRMLMILQMVADGLSPLYLSGYIEMRKRDYMESLGQAQKKLEAAPFINFIADAITVSWDESQNSKRSLLQLPSRWRSRGRWRKNSAAEKSIDLLLAQPIITATHLQRQLDISAPAANNALKQLTEARILRERTGQGRNRVFAAEEVISILARPLAEPPEEARERGWVLLQGEH